MMAPSEPQLSTTIWCQSRLPAVGKPQRGKGVSRQYFQASRRSMNNQIKHNSGPSQQTAPSEHTLAKIPTLNGHSCTRSSRWSPSALASWIILLLSIIGLSQEANLFAQAFKSCPTAQSRAFESEFGTIARRIGTTLSARKKNGGRKVPKMPTLPVSTSPPSSSIATQGNESGDEDSFYSAPKTTTVCTMVVMDVENVRGATSFRISHEALLSRIRLWREDRLSMASSASSGGGVASLEPLIWICDHGTPSIHHFSPLDDSVTDDVEMPHNFGAVFAGGRTADDVIVDLVEARCGGEYYDCDRQSPMPSPSSQTLNSLRNSTIVITADARLISRCQQARRKSNSLSDVIFVEPASLLQQLERYRINSNEEESLFGVSAPSLQISPTMSGNIKTLDGKGRRSDGKTSTMTSFKESTIAMQQHAKFQARFQNKKGTKKTKEDSTNHAKGENERVYEDEEEDEDEDDSQSQSDRADSNSAALAAQLKTEQIRRQLLLSDAYYLARPSKNVRGRRAHTTVAAVHANYKNRNISKKQQKKLYEKRFGRKRKEDMVQAATKRKELAAKLHSNLKRLNTNSYDEIDLNCDKEGEDMMLIGSKRLLEKLLGKFEEERLDRINPNDQTVELTVQTTDHATMLGFDGAAGTVGSDDRWDPLGRTVNVPLRKHARDDKARLQPLRLVVISDTHGFEGGLSRFEDSAALSEDSSPPGEHHSKIHSDEFLLPQADILLHCGDFAASGSRKTQRAAARRLDEFLARQVRQIVFNIDCQRKLTSHLLIIDCQRRLTSLRKLWCKAITTQTRLQKSCSPIQKHCMSDLLQH
ncbi:hypothetical protein ACHAWF_014126 [Thalassiosira exigua]